MPSIPSSARYAPCVRNVLVFSVCAALLLARDAACSSADGDAAVVDFAAAPFAGSLALCVLSVLLCVIALICNRRARRDRQRRVIGAAPAVYAPALRYPNLGVLISLLRLILCIVFAGTKRIIASDLPVWAPALNFVFRADIALALAWAAASYAALRAASVRHQLAIRGYVPWRHVLLIFATSAFFNAVASFRSFSAGPMQDEMKKFISICFIDTVVHVVSSVVLFYASFRKAQSVPHVEEPGSVTKEAYASLLSLAAFVWFTPLVELGQGRQLEVSDLWRLYPGDSIRGAKAAYAAAFRKLRQSRYFMQNPSKTPRVWFVILHAYRYHICIQTFLAVCSCILSFSGPYALQLVINFLEQTRSSTKTSTSNDGGFSIDTSSVSYGFAVVIGLFIATLLRSLCDNATYFRGRRVGTRSKSAVIEQVLAKALLTRRSGIDQPKLLNIMQTDSQKLMDLMSYIHYYIAAPVQIVIAVFALHKLLGFAALAGYAAMALCVPINTIVTKLSAAYQAKLMDIYDKRVSTASEFLTNISVVKIFAWESRVLKKIECIRNSELSLLKKYIASMLSIQMLWYITPYIVLIVSLVVYSGALGHNLGTNTLFTAIALFANLRMPLNVIPILVARGLEVKVSVGRIQAFIDNTCKFENEFTIAPCLSFRNASFSWSHNQDQPNSANTELQPLLLEDQEDEDDNAVLRDLCVRIPKGKLTVVIGKTGCGKTSFLEAVLGELHHISGTLERPDAIAYVAQKPCLFNASVQENVCFGEPLLDKSRFMGALAACALDLDLKELIAQTGSTEVVQQGLVEEMMGRIEVGERGCNLSGGQRARLDLCRAAYSNLDLVLMDDVLSALDAPTARHVFEKCVLDFMSTKTRVLVTHALRLVLPKADYLVILENGKIVQHGPPSQVVIPEGTIENIESEALPSLAEIDQAISTSAPRLTPPLVLAPMTGLGQPQALESPAPPSMSASVQGLVVPPVSPSSLSLSSLTHNANASSSIVPQQQQQQQHQHDPKQTLREQDQIQRRVNLTAEEERGAGSISWATYMAWVRPAGGLAMFAIPLVLLLAGQNWLTLFQNFKLRDVALSYDLKKDAGYDDAMWHFKVFGFYLLATIVVTLLRFCFQLYGSLRASRKLHYDVLNSLVHAKLGFFEKTPIGRVVNRISKDFVSIDRELTFNLAETLAQCVQMTTIVGIVAYVQPIILLFLVPVLYLFYRIAKIFLPVSRELKRIESVTRSPVFSVASELVTGLTTIRAYGMNHVFARKLENKVDVNHQAFFYLWVSNRWLSARTDVVGAVTVFLTGCMLVLTRNTVDPALAGLTLTYVLGTTEAMMWLIRMQALSEMDFNSIERVNEWTVESSIPQETSAGRDVEPSWPPRGEIKVTNLTAAYKPEGMTLYPVLSNITCVFGAGMRVAICGRTGAGKSSFSRAMLGFMPHMSGKIEIDGVCTDQLSLRALRRSVVLVPQESVLFSGTIRSNLDVFDEHSDEEILDVLRRVQLSSTVQLDTEVQAHGGNLSAGMRQQIGLARALLRKPKIVLLDEATSNVDAETDAVMQETLRRELVGCTVITIAHRLSTIIDYDLVLVLEKGKVAQKGSPSDLLKDESGLFYEMCRQSGELDQLKSTASEADHQRGQTNKT